MELGFTRAGRRLPFLLPYCMNFKNNGYCISNCTLNPNLTYVLETSINSTNLCREWHSSICSDGISFTKNPSVFSSFSFKLHIPKNPGKQFKTLNCIKVKKVHSILCVSEINKNVYGYIPNHKVHIILASKPVAAYNSCIQMNAW